MCHLRRRLLVVEERVEKRLGRSKVLRHTKILVNGEDGTAEERIRAYRCDKRPLGAARTKHGEEEDEEEEDDERGGGGGGRGRGR